MKWCSPLSRAFPKNDTRRHRMPKQVFLAHFELVVARFGPAKTPKCLKNGLLRDIKRVKNESRMWFSKNDTEASQMSPF